MLRGWAALAVVVHHMLEVSNAAASRFSPRWIVAVGSAGVDIFFVISGFIMIVTTFPASGDRPGAREFLLKRAARIYPLYWICCLPMIAAWQVGVFDRSRLGAGESLRALALLPGAPMIIPFAWTLIYELYFYLGFAQTLASRDRWRAAMTTIAIFATMTAAATLLLPVGKLRDFLASPMPAEFCLGLVIAAWHGAGGRLSLGRRQVATAAIVALALSAALYPGIPLMGLPEAPRVLLWGIPSAALVVASLDMPASDGPRRRMLLLLGDASYAIYLTHFFVMLAYMHVVQTTAASAWPQLPLVIATVLLCVVGGVATHLIVERPVTGWANRAARKLAGRSDGAFPDGVASNR